MKRILINATQNEEIRVALCKGNHLYDFDLENRTREQKKSNIYKGHVTRVEPSLEAVFVEYGSQRQGFLPIREISAEYLSGNPREENIKKLIKEGDEIIVQVEKEERGNKGAALSTYVSLAGRYLVLMPNNPRGGGISRQISGKLREDMKRMLGNLDLPKGMSVIIRTAGIGKNQEELQHDLNHLLNIWQAIQEQNQKYPSPRLVHQEAGVVTRAVRDYLRDDIAEIWIDNENAYIEAAGFIDAVMPKQAEKLRKYTDYEPMFSRFNIEKQIETAYQREVRLPSGGSIVIDQTEALVSIDINSAKSTKGSDVAETAYHTNLEAADEIARQLRLRDMGGLIVIDFIDMNDNKHQKEVEKRLIDATKYDRARVQFGDISKFGLMEMSRQRLRPSFEESTGYICPRCHGNGMIRDLRSLSLSIMRQIEQIALKERQGEVQAEVPTDIAAFLLNEKRDSIVYLEQDSGTRITILPHAHLESPNFKLHFNRDGFAPTSYERITDTQQQEHSGLGYDVDWQTAEKERPEQQPTRQPRQASDTESNSQQSGQQSNRAPQQNSNQQGSQRANQQSTNQQSTAVNNSNDQRHNKNGNEQQSTTRTAQSGNVQNVSAQNHTAQQIQTASSADVAPAAAQPQAVAWLSNLFAQAPQAQTVHSVSSRDAAEAIEALVNTGAQSLGSFGQVDNNALHSAQTSSEPQTSQPNNNQQPDSHANRQQARRNTDNNTSTDNDDNAEDRRRRKPPRKSRSEKPHQRRDQSNDTVSGDSSDTDSKVDNSSVDSNTNTNNSDSKQSNSQDKRQHDNRRSSDRNRNNRQNNERNNNDHNNAERNNTEDNATDRQDSNAPAEQTRTKRKPHSQRSSRGKLERGETLTAGGNAKQSSQQTATDTSHKDQPNARRNQDPNEVIIQVSEAPAKLKSPEVVHLSLDDSKSEQTSRQFSDKPSTESDLTKRDTPKDSKDDNATQQGTEKPSTDDQKVDTYNKSVSSASADDTEVNSTTALSVAEVKGTEVSPTDNQTQSDAHREDKVDDIQANDSKPSVAEQPTSNGSTGTQDSVLVAVDTVQLATDAQKSDNDTVDTAATDSTTDNSENNSDPVLELTHDALFAKRYVTANKFGQADNDPRVVRRQQAQSQATPVVLASQQTVASMPTIHSTVGEFIHATLPDAQDRLADDGVIKCFIAAIAIHQEQAQGNAKHADADESNAGSDNVEASRFSFSNYGYQPLTADYLARFEMMTQAVSQFAAVQGKTAVEPRAINKRASNDPRGQHRDYNESEQQQHATLSVPSESVLNDNFPSANLSSDNVLNEQVEQPSQNDAQPQDANETSAAENYNEIAVDAVNAHDIEASALTSEEQADDISADSEQLLRINQDQEGVTEQTDAQIDAEQADPSKSDHSVAEESVKQDSQMSKSKTTIASYKNMIENVAEQLLPQTGMFSLTTPKVPKARSRKPKTDHKKPTQAEKSKTDGSDSDS